MFENRLKRLERENKLADALLAKLERIHSLWASLPGTDDMTEGTPEGQDSLRDIAEGAALLCDALQAVEEARATVDPPWAAKG